MLSVWEFILGILRTACVLSFNMHPTSKKRVRYGVHVPSCWVCDITMRTLFNTLHIACIYVLIFGTNTWRNMSKLKQKYVLRVSWPLP
jgi:hypothetical protein